MFGTLQNDCSVVKPDGPRRAHELCSRIVDLSEAESMNDEKITVRVTGTGQTLDVVVLNKRAERIEVVLGEGVHSVRCGLTPTRNGLAYAGNALGREIVYERSREAVQADLDRLNPALRKPRHR
jgi:hypothetical protein